MFLARVVNVGVDESLLDEKGSLQLGRCGLAAYSHGGYFETGKLLGTFGYSVRKKAAGKSRNKHAGKKKQPCR